MAIEPQATTGLLAPPTVAASGHQNPRSFPTTATGAYDLVAGRRVALPYGALRGAFRQERQCRPSGGWQGALLLFLSIKLKPNLLGEFVIPA